MQKEDKERVVSELTDNLKSSDTMIVADYRGLTMPQIDDLRGKLLEHGAKFTVVKNTLTRRAAKDAGADALLAPHTAARLGLTSGDVATLSAGNVSRSVPILTVAGSPTSPSGSRRASPTSTSRSRRPTRWASSAGSAGCSARAA